MTPSNQPATRRPKARKSTSVITRAKARSARRKKPDTAKGSAKTRSTQPRQLHQEVLPAQEMLPFADTDSSGQTSSKGRSDVSAKGVFTSKDVLRVVKISYRQLDYWDRTGFIKPSGAVAKGSGSRRAYSYHDLLRFKIAKKLLDGGVTFKAVQKAFKFLEEELKEDIGSAHLIIHEGSVVYARDKEEMIDLLNSGQGVLNLLGLSAVKIELNAEIIQLNRASESAKESHPKAGSASATASRASTSARGPARTAARYPARKAI